MNIAEIKYLLIVPTQGYKNITGIDSSRDKVEYARKKGFVTKTGIMVGCGEEKEEIIQLMKDARAIETDILTIGQYLPPSKQHYAIHRYYHPDEFEELNEIGLELGFKHIESGPLVRSSYHAEAHVI